MSNFWPEKINSPDWVIAFEHFFVSMALSGVLSINILFIIEKYISNSGNNIVMITVDFVTMFFSTILSAKFNSKIFKIENSQRIVFLSLLFTVGISGGLVILSILFNQYDIYFKLSSFMSFLLTSTVFYFTSKRYLKNNII